MKICIPTETNEGQAAEVYGHFGSAPYFTIYDMSDNTVEVINNLNEHHSHGTCHPMGALAGRKVDAVVCGGMGGRAVQMLNEGGIKVYRAIAGKVADVVSQFAKGGLEEITVRNACAQHGCH